MQECAPDSLRQTKSFPSLRSIIVAVVLAFASANVVCAQSLSDAYYMAHPHESRHDLSSDIEHLSSLPYTLVGSTATTGLFDELARYGLGQVYYLWRGMDERVAESTRLAGVELHNPLERYADYNLTYLLWRVPSERQWGGYGSPSSSGSLVSTHFNPRLYNLPIASSAKFYASVRNYRLGASYSGLFLGPRGWTFALSAGGRWGRDAFVEGLFTDQQHLYLAAEREFTRHGLSHRLMVAAMCTPTLRSSRSWNVQEVYDLTGNNLYNSYWGLQGVEQRSARTRREVVPTLLMTYDIDDSHNQRLLELSALLRMGRKSRSSLEWDGAATPLPDHYSYLPSGYKDAELAERARLEWLSADSRYTQIDWNNLYLTNSLSQRGAVYALMSERSDMLSAQLAARMPLTEWASVGVECGHYSSHEYNVAADMFGADHLAANIERYDFGLRLSEVSVSGSLHHSSDYGHLDASGSLGWQHLSYANAPTALAAYGADSYSHSGGEVRAKLNWSHTLGKGISVGSTLHLASLQPHYSQLLVTPRIGGQRNPYASNLHSTGAQVSGLWQPSHAWQLGATLYAHLQGGGGEVIHFWNDLTDTYSTLAVGNQSIATAGAEITGQWRSSGGLTVQMGLSLTESRYTSDAVADILLYDTGELQASATRIALRGQRPTTSPSVVALMALSYYTPSGWRVGAECTLAAGRWLEPSLFYNSSYLLDKNIAPEHRAAFTSQPDLGGALNIDLSAWRRWGPLSLSVQVRNVLGGTQTVYSAYRPSRVAAVDNDHSQSYAPHATRYLYAYPAHLYLTVGYDF